MNMTATWERAELLQDMDLMLPAANCELYPQEQADEAAMKWTQDQAVAYECAQEAITEAMSLVSEQLEAEETSEAPDRVRLAQLQDQLGAMAKERRQLVVTDDAQVAECRRRYGQLVNELQARKGLN